MIEWQLNQHLARITSDLEFAEIENIEDTAVAPLPVLKSNSSSNLKSAAITNTNQSNGSYSRSQKRPSAPGERRGRKSALFHSNNMLLDTQDDMMDSKQSTNSSSYGNVAGAVNAEGEPVYCFCRQVSYGEMIACDNQECATGIFILLIL